MTIQQAIRDLALDYSNRLSTAIDSRTEEMLADDVSHYLIYRVLGISFSEGQKIDLYQNKGRYLYKYAGSFLEQATKKCFEYIFPESGSIRIPMCTPPTRHTGLRYLLTIRQIIREHEATSLGEERNTSF
ncbi:MAG: ApaLI family restriction endonuclease [Methylobacter sp.]|nr:ApaLI family restriction endonuclease [Methylobacter sp.]